MNCTCEIRTEIQKPFVVLDNVVSIGNVWPVPDQRHSIGAPDNSQIFF